MKTKLFSTMAIVAIIALAIIGCKGDEPTDTPVTREFTDLTFLGKSIKLIDETNNPKDLKARGIWKQIQDGLTELAKTAGSTFPSKFDIIHSNFKIRIVKDNTALNFDLGYAIDGYEILFRESDIQEYDTNTIRTYVYEAVIYDINTPNT